MKDQSQQLKSSNVIAQIARDEGLRLKPYRDSRGVLTIGYGRNLESVGITQDEAQSLLCNDISRHFNALAAALPWVSRLDDSRQSALVNMSFNLGLKGLLKFRKALAAIESGHFTLAAQQLLKSSWAEQVGGRAIRIAKQIETGEWQ
ncbi:MAG TPA: glycoside hydrolase family protein [Candidatus Angelobacter sp.]|nr:glycoside hydrolase family protein [Candidatus Angelobacter sp.]